MSQYTEFFEDLAYTISPDDDDYEEKLREMVSHFRPFDKALTTFITNHGYGGDSSNIEDKVLFLQGKFKSASIPVPRNLKNWFTKHIRVEPET
ncbi:MAG: hypothetical protein LBN34_07960, partial [Clostridiales Family XIII bacterium]|nr:hypothetical protein [Clostridiales Family XIII bacterium]